MKRKGRKSKNVSNGVASNAEEGSSHSEGETAQDSPENRPKRSQKRNKDESKAAVENVEPDVEEPINKKKRGSQKKSPATPEKDEAETDEQYEVEAILGEKVIKGVRHYLIRWKGYEEESDTWEPEATLSCPELIADYRSKHQQKKGRPKGPRSARKGDADDETEYDENEKFEVERILDVYFKKNGEREFLVLWKGYPNSQSSWEPEENMDCAELIERFMSKVNRAKESDQRELRVSRKHTDRFTLNTFDSGRRLSKRNRGKQRIRYDDAE